MHDIKEFSYLALFGGLAFFIYGLRLARVGLQEVGEQKLRTLISSVTENRFSALGMGVVVTSFLQSSTATTLMLVGFANTGLITLVQAMGVILGADLGTTVTVQLIALDLSEWSLLLVIVGIVVSYLWRKTRHHKIGNAVLGFGLIFYGMSLMTQATSPLRDSAAFQQFLILIESSPALVIVASAILTALLTSSSATIGLALSLAQSGSMTLNVAILMVLGANIGTCATAFLVGLGSRPRGRQVAYAHLAFKVAGTLLVYPFLLPFAAFCHNVSQMFWIGEPTIAREIANAHTIFNLGISVLFLPFIGVGAKLIQKLEPEKGNGTEKEEFRARFLDENSLETPALAQGCVTRETMRVAEIVHEMFKDSLTLFEHQDESLMERIESDDDRVDLLDREIRFYLAKIAQHELTKEQSERQVHLLNITTNLEFIGDTINRDLVKLAKKMNRLNVSFSAEGWKEITDFHEKVSQNFDLALSAFADRNLELARKVLRHEATLGELEAALKQNHLARLQAGLKESLETSSIHLELLAELRRINTLLTHLANAVTNQH